MRRVTIGLLALATAIAGVLVLPPAAPLAAHANPAYDNPAYAVLGQVSVTRYGGADRYETSLQVAEAVAAEAGGFLSSVVLVSGRRWTDAVVAAPLAGWLDAPVLMTPPDELRDDALEFLQRTSVSSVVVVGPDASGGVHGPGRGVGAEVIEALEAAGLYVERVAGHSRYGTGVAAAQQVTPGEMGDWGPTAVIASGEVFADALVAGPFAAHGVHPVLLTPPSELHPEVAAYLSEAGIEHVVLMGGTAALSGAVEQSVTDLGIKVRRAAGATRFGTAVKAAELAENQYSYTAGRTCFDTQTIGLARARVPFDSFSAAPLLARLCAPLVLAEPGRIPDDTAGFLDAAREGHAAVNLEVFGGESAVSQAAIDAYLTGTDDNSDVSHDEESGDEGTPESGDAVDSYEGSVTAAVHSTPHVLPTGACGGAINDAPKPLLHSTGVQYPAWSPDCQHLIYTHGTSLWIVDNDGTNARELIESDGAFLKAAVWSPDGNRIAYARRHLHSEYGYISHIWTANADGTHSKQRTEGDVVDDWPTWSPDGERIAFERYSGSGRDEHGHRTDDDRYIVLMTSDGDNLTPLNRGGDRESSPAWSPDGTLLAYESDGNLLVSDIDGTNARLVTDGATLSGVSWSPDGLRIAFVRASLGKRWVAVVDLTGLNERVVAEGRFPTSPRWSPDGQLIAFHAFNFANSNRIIVAGVGTELVDRVRKCRPDSASRFSTTAGFPLPDWAPAAVGTVRVAVLFMDFPDAQATHTTHEEAALGLPRAEEYLEAVSYGKLDVEFVPLHRWLRAERSHTDYAQRLVFKQGLGGAAREHAVKLADPDFDFSGVSAVMVVFPSSYFGGGGNAGHLVPADGILAPHSSINDVYRRETVTLSEVRNWGNVAAHELAHNLGLLDMYPYDRNAHRQPEPSSGYEWIPVEFGLMGLEAYFLADASLMLRRVTKYYADGSSARWTVGSLAPQEMLAWSRWQLGWLDVPQVHCDSGEGATVSLAPIAQPGGGVAMAAVPLSRHELIVVESRRKLGQDRGEEFMWSQGDYGRAPALIQEGVLVYTVDTLLDSGELPLKVAGDSGNGQVDGFPVLGVGESVTLRGYTITVTADDGNTHTVKITPNG